MIGAIIGDVIGSVYENENIKSTDFNLFSRFSRYTDDTVLTIAVADALLHRRTHPIRFIQDRQNQQLYAHKLKEYGRRYPNAGYGEMFKRWMLSNSLHGYGSYGNGSAMRVSSIGFAFNTLEDVLREARLSALPTHNHPEAVKGAQAIASAIFLTRTGYSKEQIKQFVEHKFGYNLNQQLDDIRPTYAFDSSCKGSVLQAIMAFLESENFEDAIRNAISIGGDSDTIACMTGGIAQAYYKEIPPKILLETRLLLDASFKQIVDAFEQQYMTNSSKS